MTAATDRLEELIAEQEDARTAVQRAQSALDTARLRFREGSCSVAELQQLEAAHGAAVGVLEQIRAERSNAADEQRITQRRAEVEHLRNSAQREWQRIENTLSDVSRKGVKAALAHLEAQTVLAQHLLQARSEFREIEQKAEEYARATGLIDVNASEVERLNARERVLKEWSIPIAAIPYNGLPPVPQPSGLSVTAELASYEATMRQAAPLVFRLAGVT